MDKPATVVLEFDKTSHSSWFATLEFVDKVKFREFTNDVVAMLSVTKYSLEDHQFIHVKWTAKEGNEVALGFQGSL